MTLAAASADQSTLSREGEVPATLTRSVPTTAGALVTDVNDCDRLERFLRIWSPFGNEVSLLGERNEDFSRGLLISNGSTTSDASFCSADSSFGRGTTSPSADSSIAFSTASTSPLVAGSSDRVVGGDSSVRSQ